MTDQQQTPSPQRTTPEPGGGAPSPAPKADQDGRRRMTLGRDVVALSIVAAVAIGAIALSVFSSGAEAAGVIGLFTTLVGTLSGIVFGAQITQHSATEAVAQAQAGQVAALFVDPTLAPDALKGIQGINSSRNGNPGDGDI